MGKFIAYICKSTICAAVLLLAGIAVGDESPAPAKEIGVLRQAEAKQDGQQANTGKADSLSLRVPNGASGTSTASSIKGEAAKTGSKANTSTNAAAPVQAMPPAKEAAPVKPVEPATPANAAPVQAKAGDASASVAANATTKNSAPAPTPELTPTVQAKSAPPAAPSKDKDIDFAADIKSDYTLTLAQCEQLALHYSYALKAARVGKDVAKAKMTQAYSEALPTVTASGSRTLTSQKGPLADSYYRESTNNLYGTELAINQPLFKAGKIGAALRAAKLYGQSTTEDIRLAEQDMIYQVRVAYYGIVQGEEVERVLQEQVNLARKYLDDVNARKAQGMATNYDTLSAEVEETNDETDLLAAQNSLVNNRSSLLRLLGLPLTSSLKLLDRLKYEPRVLDQEDILYARAMGLRPEVQSSGLNIKLQQENITSTRAGLLPQLSMFGAWDENTGAWEGGDTKWTRDWKAGLTLEWTLFDGMLIRGKIDELKAQLEQMRLKDKDLADNVRLEVRKALLDIHNAQKRVAGQEKNIEKARESYRLAVLSEKQGVKTTLDVLTARKNLSSAEQNYLQALYAYNTAWADLELNMGVISAGPLDGMIKAAKSEQSKDK